jgi:carboxyl-terminal processing protease
MTMKKSLILIGLTIGFSSISQAGSSDRYSEWKDHPNEKFTESETNFKLAMDKILQEYVDKGVSRDDLYRAATSGMLEALNTGEHTWNTLLTPREYKELEADLSGHVSGIGIELKFDGITGHAQVLRVIPNSPSARAGLQRDDQILSVNGKKFKGKQIHDLVGEIQGKSGESVSLKYLRDDKIISANIKRESILWTPVELSKLNPSTEILTVGYFTSETPKLVESKMAAINAAETKNLIIDVRGNSGGGFSQAVETAELFVAKNKAIVSTKDRNGKTETFTSKKGLLRKDLKVIILTNGGTSSGAELFVGALKENLNAKVVGEGTYGKWNAQTIQTLSNGFAIKYSILGFQTPEGHSYQNVGLKPDVEVAMPKDVDARELRMKYDAPHRLEQDTQLKAAMELLEAS